MKMLAYVCVVLCLTTACSKHHSTGAPITYVGTASLSEPRTYLASAFSGNKAVFAGGLDFQNNNLSSATVDIYDAGTSRWTTAKLSEPRYGVAGGAAGGKFLFAGGFDNTIQGNFACTNLVDIYDTATGNWTTAQLSVARFVGATASLGNWIFFAGGYDQATGTSTTVDIYNASTGVWSTAQLSAPKAGLAAASVGSKVFFAGGNNGIGSATVDIYDTLTRAWTTAQLSEARTGLVAAAAGGKILFAGGVGGNILNSATVDIYDAATAVWTTAHLCKAREYIAAAVYGNKIVFGGGSVLEGLPGGYDVDGGVTDTVDVYDAQANSWTVTRLSQAREGAVGATAGNELLIAGGSIPINPGNTSTFYKASATVDVFLVSGH